MAGDSHHFAKVPNDLALAWASLKLSPAEAAVIWVLQVKIIGAYDHVRHRVGRCDVRISSSDLADLTGYGKPRILAAVHRLAKRGVLYITDRGAGQRPMRVALCMDARLLRPPVAIDATDGRPVVTIDEALASCSPTMRAAVERLRGLADTPAVPLAHEGAPS